MKALTDPMPLRLTSAWGGYRTLEIIPIRFGDVRGKCVQYQTASLDVPPRKFWVWSDGACAGVDQVYIDGQQVVGGWIASNQTDVTGQPVMMIEFAEPIAQGGVVTASGRGQIRSGVMLQNPARVMAEIARIAGIDAPQLDLFEIQCARLGILLSGELASDMTIQRAIRSVCDSVGAIYSPRMRVTAAIYPGGEPELVGSSPRVFASIDAEHITGAECELSGVVNALSVSYAMRDGAPSKTMTLEAPASILAYGRRTGERRAEWISDEGIAANVFSRALRYLARPPYQIQIDGVRDELRPGDYIDVDASHSLAPFATGVHQVPATRYQPSDGISSAVFAVWADPAPAIVVTGSATQLEDQQFVKFGVATVGDQRQVTLTGEGGAPLNGAKCVLDGVTTRYADAAGIVTFPVLLTPPGWHDLTITTSGSGQTQPFSTGGGEAGPVTVPGQSVSIPVTFTIRVLFQ